MGNQVLHRIRINENRSELITDAEYRARLDDSRRHLIQWVYGWILVGILLIVLFFIILSPFIALVLK